MNLHGAVSSDTQDAFHAVVPSQASVDLIKQAVGRGLER
jgi:hypothetical protein